MKIRLTILLTIALLALTSCIAPDGSTITVATVDEENRLQVQRIEVSAEEEYYRGIFTMCMYVSATQSDGYADVTGCYELVVTAYVHGEHRNAEMLSLWDWELVKQ